MEVFEVCVKNDLANTVSQFGNFLGFVTSVLLKEMAEVYEWNFISRMFPKVLRG